MTIGGEESRLIERARQGDREAFADLVRVHADRVRRLAAGILGDDSEAEDASQEAFVRAWRSLGKFRGDSSFSTWLHRITVNHCRDLLRRRRRGGWLSFDGVIEAVAGRRSVEEEVPDKTPAGAETKEELKRVLEILPEDYRTVLLLRELNGLSYAEISQVMKCSVDSVKARLKRARKAALDGARHLGDGNDV